MQKIVEFFTYISRISLVVLVVLVVYDALMRYLFSEGSTALQELEWHLFDVVILLSIAYTFNRASHVRVDIFYEHFGEKTKNRINIFGIVFFIVPFSLMIVYLGYDFVFMSYMQHEASSDPGGLCCRWIVKSLVVVSFVLLVIEAVVELIQRVFGGEQC